MNTPQIIAIVLIALGSGVSLAKNGTPKNDYNVTDWLISPLIWVALLYWGGFWQ